MRSRGAVLLAGAVLVGLAGASAGLFGDVRGADRTSPLLGRVAFDVAVGVLLTYVVFALGITVWALLSGGRSGVQLPERRRKTLLEMLLLLGVCLIAAAGLHQLRGDDELVGRETETEGTPGVRTDDAAGKGPTTPATDVAIIGSVMALLVGGVVVMVLRDRAHRLPDDELDPSAAPGAVAGAAGAAAADLRAETDPRRAVVAAYLRMDAGLAEYGLGRQPAEAPLEHLARVLRDAGIPAGPAHRLVDLFERARFSSRPVDAAMRDEALAHLEAVRDHLAPAPAPA